MPVLGADQPVGLIMTVTIAEKWLKPEYAANEVLPDYPEKN